VNEKEISTVFISIQNNNIKQDKPREQNRLHRGRSTGHGMHSKLADSCRYRNLYILTQAVLSLKLRVYWLLFAIAGIKVLRQILDSEVVRHVSERIQSTPFNSSMCVDIIK